MATTINPYSNNLVNIAESCELKYWTRLFDVSPEKLKSAVRAVGVSAEAIALYLKK